ncbi:MAG: DUF1667 domain-containing protein, partial [Treponema sp.]|nr:DUF1667 domain-containing protein [Treponema sp.]
ISAGELPKAKLGECLALLYRLEVEAPLRHGDVIVKDICGTGVDVVAARSLGEWGDRGARTFGSMAPRNS